MHKAIVTLAFSTISLFGQANITFSPQGSSVLRALTGKRISGFQIVAAMACDFTVSGGQIYEAATQQGYAWTAPEATATLITRTANIDWRNIVPTLLANGTSGAALLVAGGVIHAPAAWLTGLIAGHGALDLVQSQIRAYAPDPTQVLSKLAQVSETITLEPGQCAERFIGAQFTGKPKVTPSTAVVTSAIPYVNTERLQKIMKAHEIWENAIY